MTMTKTNLKDYHGWQITDAEWDYLTQNCQYIEYSNAEDLEFIKNRSFSFIKSTLLAIDNFILNVEWEDNVADPNLIYLATEFFKSSLVHEALEYDYISLEQTLTVICGIKNKNKQSIVYQMIENCMQQIGDLCKKLYH
jgi:hypothetical protein